MRKPAFYLINALTLYRLFSAPALIWLAVAGQFEVFKWLLMLSFLTDAIDGPLSRRYHLHWKKGPLLDSIADDATVFAGVMGAFLTEPLFFLPSVYPFLGLLALFLIQMIFALIRYKRVTSFHTYLAKAAAITQALFLFSFFWIPDWREFTLTLAVVCTAFDLLEEITLVLLLEKWRANVPSVFYLNHHD